MPDARLFKQIVDSSKEGVYFVDLGRRITYWNKGAEELTGYMTSDVLGSSCADNILVHVDGCGDHLCLTRCPLAKAMNDGLESCTDTIYLHHRAGHRIPVDVRIIPIIDDNGLLLGAAEIFNERRNLNAEDASLVELKRAALYDQLTGLPNRRFLEMALSIAFEEVNRGKLQFGIILADIDHFKLVNDTYGHDCGDEVLQMVATTLNRNRRQYDLSSRWGGEEFVILLKFLDNEQLHQIAEKLRNLVAASFLKHGDESLQVTITMGVTMGRPEDTVHSLLKRADLLLYEGKSNGRNRVVCG